MEEQKTQVEGQEKAEATNAVDYKAMFEKLQAEFATVKNDLAKKSEAFDKASSEVAEFKRKQKENMSEDEKKKAEYDALIENNKKFEVEIAKLRTEKELAQNGFSKEESDVLLEANCPIELIKPLAEMKAKWLEENSKSVKAGFLKDKTLTAPMGGGLPNAKEKSEFAEWQEQKEKKEFAGKVEL